MSIDSRTRRRRDRRDLARDEVFDSILPDAIERHGELAARGMLYKELPPLGLEVEGRAVSLREQDGKLILHEGEGSADAVASIGADALSDLVQDWKTTMGLAMNAKVKMTRGAFDAWISWEPVYGG